MIRMYMEIVRMRFLMMLAYRVNYYSGILVYTINIGAYYFLWKAVYGAAPKLAGFTLAQMTTYVAVTWMARAFYFNNLDRELSNEIKDGSVAIQMIRPYNYLVVKMMQGFGEGIFRFFLFSIPGMILVYFLFPIHLPLDAMRWIVFILMLVFSFIINSQINIIVGLLTFFIESNEGIMRAKRVLVDLMSGVIVPMSFMPLWAKPIIAVLPFQAIAYLPANVITGRVAEAQLWHSLWVPITWSLLLVLPIYLIWQLARRRLFVQGG
jgi:ABC-2 type transport system permease protein